MRHKPTTVNSNVLNRNFDLSVVVVHLCSFCSSYYLTVVHNTWLAVAAVFHTITPVLYTHDHAIMMVKLNFMYFYLTFQRENQVSVTTWIVHVLP